MLSCVMLRRTKNILNLPHRQDKIVRPVFTDEEKEHYRRIEQPVFDMLDQPTGDQNNPGNLWMSTIQQINKLRLVCNLGTASSAHQRGIIQLGSNNPGQAIIATRLSISGETCRQCLQPFLSSSSEDWFEGSASPSAYYSACDRIFCAACSALSQYQTPSPCGCPGLTPSCRLLPVLCNPTTPSLTPSGASTPTPMDEVNEVYISSKIRTAVGQIKTHPAAKQ
jgi:hypothetical protein